ncbi:MULTISPECIES: type I-E CRISPR-associated protein Cse1/CasA [unclassified Streptomyces]|uniref:type I-E CRISPR-associated protein Cse1/CasA n=1 Tax=unclassified Streptomyces TaxID=2593676 RepID=UPI000DADC798|nr:MULTISPECIES: type I-E CRISPR-associated protein Cse1/CasA [unclassified Streptomyces]PZT76270.1 type I-E CRISPR-associated protein Cse1/CasA [Streptomyces sp. AC1-42W]PZT79775.1 type I-E CRISPR-associated protein Cse1/CasA [Streptomyces sp. AC1-42T]
MTETDENAARALSFDLTSEPWIPVLRLNGEHAELSLRQVFGEAHRLRRIVGDLPTQEFVLLRLLLAIAHDALDGPRDVEHWAELRADEAPFAPIGGYLDEHRDRFDLFHARTPFFQVAGLHTAKGEVFSLNRIVADVPNGAPFFSSRMPGAERLTYAEAARWTVHAHAYDTSGIKTGVVGDDRTKGGRVYPLGVGWAGNLGGVFAEGPTLRDTLLLNMVAPADTEGLSDWDAGDDLPAWRRDPCGPGAQPVRRPTGVRDLYTWQTRRILLHADGDGVHGVVLGYGDPLNARNKHGCEPMTAWRRSKAQEKKHGEATAYMPREHDPTRSAWRGLESLIANRGAPSQGAEAANYLPPRLFEWIARLVTDGELDERFLIRARIIGAQYGTQQSVIDEVVDDHVAMAVVLLHARRSEYAEQAISAVKDAEEAVTALGDLATNLARAARTESDGPRLTARDQGFHVLGTHYRTWLAALDGSTDPYESRAEWQRQVHRIVSRLGEDLIDRAGDSAWQGVLITVKSRTEWLNAGLAGNWFRHRLDTCLGHPRDSDRSTTDTGGEPEAVAPAAAAPATEGHA